MNVKDSIKKVGAVAASTLMVGMTMGAAQSLSEFPGMFTDDDGAPTAQVVVGSQGAVSDVVGAVNIAAALGQATVQTSEQTETVDVETSGSIGWSASDGETLDTRNDQLYFNDNINTVRQTLTEDHLDALSTSEFQDDAGNTQDVEHFLYPQSSQIQFGVASESNVDPFLYVDNPAEPSTVTGGLYKLQANFGEGLELDKSGAESDGESDGNDDVLGEEITLFGKSFTISQDSFDSNHQGQLVLFGSSQEYDLETGQSTTFTINGNEHTLEVRAVTDSDTTAFYVDGNLREKNEGQTFNVDGETVRVDDVIQTSSQNSEGLVTFSIGSEEFRLEDGQPVQDSNGEDIDGTHVNLEGTNVGGAATLGDNTQIEISSVEIGVGAADSDDSYVRAGDSFDDPIFGGVSFKFGGLAPDAGEGAGDAVGEIEFGTGDDNTADVDFADGSNEATVEWFYDDDPSTDAGDGMLADGDGDSIVVTEGADVTQDDYIAVDAGDFAHLYEVTNVDRDATGKIASDDEATIDLRETVTGASVEVDLDSASNDGTWSNGDEYYAGSEVIDGQTYNFVLEGSTDGTGDDGDATAAEFKAGYDSGSTVSTGASVAAYGSNLDLGNEIALYPALDVDSGAAIAMADQTPTLGVTVDSTTTSATFTLPSTESTDAQTMSVVYNSNGNMDFEVNGADVFAPDSSGLSDGGADGAVTDAGNVATINVGQVTYAVTYDVTDSDDDGTVNADTVTVQSVALSGDGAGSYSQAADASTGGSELTDPASLVIEPEDDNDQEQRFVVEPGVDTADGEVEVSGEDTGNIVYPSTAAARQNLDSDDDMYTTYDTWGTHSIDDQGSAGTFTLHVPNQQSVAGAGFTGEAGDLTMGGSSTGQGEVTYTGVTNEDIRGALPDIAKTDSQVTSSDRQNSNLILVGGPAVNTLVADLASQGETWTTDQWRNEHQDEALLQVVQDAFADGQHAMIVAGYSADDTRAAARYISEWRSNQDTLSEAGMQYSPSSQEAPR